MLDQFLGLSDLLVRERLLDVRRDRLAAEGTPLSARRGSMLSLRFGRRLASRLGDLLIAEGLRLKRGGAASDFTAGWVWQDRK